MSNLAENYAAGGWELPQLAPIAFDVFRSELLTLYEFPMRAKGTRAKLLYTLDRVAELLGKGATTAGLTPQLVARFIESRPPSESPHTTHGLVACIRSASNYAKSRGYLRNTPFEFRKKWVRLSVPVRKKHHSMEEIRRVLDLMAADVRDREGYPRWRARRLLALASTVAYTGLRRDEALHLHVEDLDIPARMILLVERSRRMKTEMSAQPIPMPDALVEILESWTPHRMTEPEGGFSTPPECPFLFPNVTRTNAWKEGPIGYKPVDVMKAAGERAGVPGFTFLSLRHSYATHAESAWGLSEAMIMRVLRHTSIKTQGHYRHADVANLRAATGKIDFGPSVEAPGDGRP